MYPVNRPSDPVSTVNTTFDILELLRDQEEMTLTEIANETGLANSTIHRHLRTLHHREYLTEEHGRYRVSFRFLEFGKQAQYRQEAYRLAEQKVKELAEDTGERAQFLVEEHGQAVYVFREKGSHGVKTDIGIGSRVPLHATASGKAILAHLPAERVEAIIDWRGLYPHTPHTITDKSDLFEEFEQIREVGYSISRQEFIEGLNAVGTVVKNTEDDILGAFTIAGPAHRLKGELFQTTIPNLLLGTANELELNITHT